VLIGEFEAAVREADPDREPDTFKLQGQTFTVADQPNIIALGRFARAAREGADSDDMEGLATLIDTVASVVIPEDENRFLDVASKHRLDAELLLKIVAAVMEAQAGRPTEPSSDSSPGRSQTGESSKAISSAPEPSSRRPSWRDTPFGQRELAAHPELYEGFGTVAENGRTLSVAG
jgi:hypothetical protein